ncbi:MAG TPA: hypothetical protein VGI39_34980 [Polyangiaceae bacterium]|jgi:hypothetical protein
MTLRAFFANLDAGTVAVARKDLAAHLTPSELDALLAARLVQPGRPVTSWPCDQPVRRCGREVLESAPGAKAPFVAVCEGACDDGDACAEVPLSAEDLAQLRLDARAVVAAIREVYRLEGPAPSADVAAAAAELTRIGEERTEERTRDVFLGIRASPPVLASFLASRTRVARPTLVLVPTARAVAPEMAAAYAPGAHVELELLEDALTVRGAKIARATKLRLVTTAPPLVLAEPEAPAEREEEAKGDAPSGLPGGIAARIGAATFAQITIRVVDGHTLLISCGGKRLRATYIDLGLATSTRNPSREWGLLVKVCEGRGQFRWKDYGNMTNAKQRVSVLQKRLRMAFGLEDNPFHKFRVVDGWRARFFASAEGG